MDTAVPEDNQPLIATLKRAAYQLKSCDRFRRRSPTCKQAHNVCQLSIPAPALSTS